MTELCHERGYGHHERQVEQELERRRRSVRLVDGARRHRDPERESGLRRIDPLRHG
jgi:hypothetical protein